MFRVLLLLFPIILFAKCLSVSINSNVSNCSENMEFVDNSISLGQILVGDEKEKSFSLYLKSDSNKTIKMKILNIKTLKNSSDELTPNLSFISNIDNSKIDILSNQPFTILQSGNTQYRDGVTKIGEIKIKIPNIDDIQTEGSYSENYRVSVYIEGETTSQSDNLNISLSVPKVSYVGFSSTSSYKSESAFSGGSVNFGLVQGNEFKTKDIYAKHNSRLNLKMLFENTPNLIHNEDSSNFLSMRYYYKIDGDGYQNIVANTPFTIINSKNSGTMPIGEMKFEIVDTKGKIAGQYSATISVSIIVE